MMAIQESPDYIIPGIVILKNQSSGGGGGIPSAISVFVEGLKKAGNKRENFL
jgi:hypothetical protein